MDIRQIAAERITQFWSGNLARLPANSLGGANLPVSTEKFLSEVGLPVQDKRLSDLPYTLSFVDPSEEAQWIVYQNEKYLIIGDSAVNAKIALKQTTGEVIYLDLLDNQQVGTVSFINSGIDQFLMFLTLHLALFEQLPDSSKRKLKTLIKSMEGEFRSLDSKALEDTESWWSITIEELYDVLEAY